MNSILVTNTAISKAFSIYPHLSQEALEVARLLVADDGHVEQQLDERHRVEDERYPLGRREGGEQIKVRGLNLPRRILLSAFAAASPIIGDLGREVVEQGRGEGERLGRYSVVS